MTNTCFFMVCKEITFSTVKDYLNGKKYVNAASDFQISYLQLVFTTHLKGFSIKLEQTWTLFPCGRSMTVKRKVGSDHMKISLSKCWRWWKKPQFLKDSVLVLASWNGFCLYFSHRLRAAHEPAIQPRWTLYLRTVPTNWEVFLCGLWLCRKSRS